MWLFSASLVALLAGAPWERVDEKDGLVLEIQEVAGSDFDRVRVSGTSKARVEAFAAAWWGKADDISNNRAVAKREVLFDGENERLVYDIVAVPIGSDRDYVMRIIKRHDRENGAIMLTFETVADKRKPETEDYVRMRIEAEVVFVPEPGGGSRFLYTVFNDIGGSLPAAFLKGGLRDGTLDGAIEMRRRAEATP